MLAKHIQNAQLKRACECENEIELPAMGILQIAPNFVFEALRYSF